MKHSKQVTSHILMIRPASFGFNVETATSNAFQQNDQTMDKLEIRKKAIDEFDTFIQTLQSKFINVHVFEDTVSPEKPDAVFPNNWITFHDDGSVVTFPMEALARRQERRDDIIYVLGEKFNIKRRFYLEFFEQEAKFLEGTGSLILDRENKIAYACSSSRTDESVLDEFCRIFDYKKYVFQATDRNHREIYHTNVMMALGVDFVVICLESISDSSQRDYISRIFDRTGKAIIEITFEQMEHFAGNMLQVCNDQGQPYLVMSEQAFNSLRADQVEHIRQYTQILSSPLYTIEKFGGGSARCMMGEIFLPLKTQGA